MKSITYNVKKVFILLLTLPLFIGCDEDDAVLPQVDSQFTFTINQNTGVVTFINISENADRFLWNFGNGTTTTEINPIRVFPNGTYTVTLEATSVSGASDTFEDQFTIDIPEPPFDSGLLVNGDFSNGEEGWIGNALNVVTEGDNSFNLADVQAAGNPFDVNLSQVVEIVQGTNYILTFDASSDRERTILAGIGLNEDPFTSTAPVVNLTTQTQTFTLQLSAADFGSANSRVLFDMGAEVGTVVIDNVRLIEGGNGSDSTGGGGNTPTEAAPTPVNRDPADVISLFSNAYTNINVDTFFAGFSQGGAQTNEQVAGDDVLRYADLDFAGIETINETVDLTGMTNFSIDVWTATQFDFIAGIVDFGGDGFGGANPDTRGDVRQTLQPGQWNTIDVTIADLQAAGLTGNPADFSQLILDVVDVLGTVYVDNIFFYNDGNSNGGGNTPTEAAPTPVNRDPADVISLFSNAYTNINVDTFFAGFSQGGAQTNEQVAGDDVLRYADLDFAGIETINETVDLTGMTNFSIDVWTATQFDFIAGIVDFGGDGFGGANADTRGDIRQTLQPGQWNTIDVTIADLQAAGLTGNPADFSQLILDVVDVLGTVYVDNIFFYNDSNSNGGGNTSNDILLEEFNAATSIDSWIPVADATNASEASIAFSASEGNPDGTIVLSGTNPVDTAGRAYIFQNFFNGLDFSGATDVQLTFDIRLGAPLTAAAIQLQTEIQDQGVVNTFDLQNQGVNENTWTTITVDYNNISASANAFFRFNVNIAAGAVVNAGTTLFIDNIRIVQTN